MREKTYFVADGVSFVAGQAVRAGDSLRLTGAQALYELALGRIAVRRRGTHEKPDTGQDAEQQDGA